MCLKEAENGEPQLQNKRGCSTTLNVISEAIRKALDSKTEEKIWGGLRNG